MDGGGVGVGGSGVAVGGCGVTAGGTGVGGTEVAVAGCGVAVSVMGVCGMSIEGGGWEPVQALIVITRVKSGSGHRITFLFMSSAPCWVKLFLFARGRSRLSRSWLTQYGGPVSMHGWQ
jgi:hypothetical protein